MARFRFNKDQLKYIGLPGAFFIVALILWNTNVLFQNLKEQERKKVALWAKAQEELIQNPSPSILILNILQQTDNNPMIQVNEYGEIIGHKNVIETNSEADSVVLSQTLERIQKENKPINIAYEDATGAVFVNQKLYYGDSVLLKKLQYYPLALLLIIFLFGAVLYFGFKASKVSEQNRLWVAMAKETAHQIGTPLSSLLGWVTLLKELHPKETNLKEIEKDIDRLHIITERFSKIGAQAHLMKSDLREVVRQTADYLQKRSSEQVAFEVKLPEHPVLLSHNPQLIGWTVENIINNGIDAMKGRGRIAIILKDTGKNAILTLSDNGSGIQKDAVKKIFNPGFTTKKRGWGLGLSLARRIVVDYHKGKISVLKTGIEKGTTFQIILLKDG